MSYVAFKRDILEAFAGESVTVDVSRRAQTFHVRLVTLDNAFSIGASITDAKVPDRAARRAFALDVFRQLVENVAADKQTDAAAALHQRFGASVQ